MVDNNQPNIGHLFTLLFFSYDTSSSPVALTTGTSLQGEPYLQFEVLIDYSDPDNPVFEATDGTNLGCHFTVISVIVIRLTPF